MRLLFLREGVEDQAGGHPKEARKEFDELRKFRYTELRYY
jgi:hypothetical protein